MYQKYGAIFDYFDGQRPSIQQIRFVEMIVERLTQQGAMAPEQLYEALFTGLHHEEIEGVFCPDQADRVISIVRGVKPNARGVFEAA